MKMAYFLLKLREGDVAEATVKGEGGTAAEHEV
jgi:hypothetical protein